MQLKAMLAMLILFTAVFFAPQIFLRLTMTVYTPQTAPPSDAALIFGAVVRDGTITPLHKERLDAGLALHRSGKAPTLVVSNTSMAALTMQAYLKKNEVEETAIEVDGQAERTPDTCASEHLKPKRRVALVSQRFHLPRISLHCKRYGLTAIYVAADDINRLKAPLVTRVRVRARRLIRETIFIWGTYLGAYPHQPVR